MFAASVAAISLTPAADAQTRRATDLRLSSTTGIPSSVRPGSTITLRTTVVNRGRRTARAPRVIVGLTRGRTARRTAPRVGTRTLSAFRRGRRTRVSVRVRIGSARSGSYRVVLCVTQAGRRARCALGRRFSVVRPGLPGTTPSPAPSPEPGPATPAPVPLDQQLRAGISAEALTQHTNALADIAERNGGNRAAGTQGYDDSASYVINRLARAGYEPRIDRFDFIRFEEAADPQLTSSEDTYSTPEDFVTMTYSGGGDTGAARNIVGVDLGTTPTPDGDPPSSNTSGCEAADFAAFVAGDIALLKRGTCTFGEKATNAVAAGASGVIIFNEGQPGREEILNGTLGAPVENGEEVPVIGTTAAVGEVLAAAAAPTGQIVVDATSTPSTSYNVLADTPAGDAARTMVVGAHLDSVDEGAGINDNGSGTAFVLELAEQMAALGVTPANRVRFAFWGAEEAGLVGSTEYVLGLSDPEFEQIGLNLNFDMLGSPNHGRFIYDGDFSDTPPPAGVTTLAPGSAEVERAFEAYFGGQSLGTLPTAFDGRSDYQAFQNNGVPAGGLFSGAEDVKTAEEAALFGGTAGVAFDPNYHQAGDGRGNLDLVGFEQMADAAGQIAYQYATTALPEKFTARAARSARTRERSATAGERRGDRLQR